MSELYLLNDGQKKSLEELCQQAEFATLLYFYPKDDTPGCTIEGNDFSALNESFAEQNTVIYEY